MKSPVRPASPPRPPGPGRSGRPAGTTGVEQTGAATTHAATTGAASTAAGPTGAAPTRTVPTRGGPTRPPLTRGAPTRSVPRTAELAGDQARQAQYGQVPPAATVSAGTVSAGHAHRTSFVLLLLGLLGGGMVCLLVVNTTLAANSIQIRNLQQQNANVSEQVQELQEQVATARSAGMIEREARKLGMRPDPYLVFLNLHSKKIVAQPGKRAIPAGSASHSAKAKSRHLARPGAGRGKTGQGKTDEGKTVQGGAGQGGTGQ
ncbi:MAG TPA: hypothetical protein VFI65_30640 [Streptosporangiaceae bacterium]|nr:hypothetical protein [Streptosporangiaceae bacterium]